MCGLSYYLISFKYEGFTYFGLMSMNAISISLHRRNLKNRLLVLHGMIPAGFQNGGCTTMTDIIKLFMLIANSETEPEPEPDPEEEEEDNDTAAG